MKTIEIKIKIGDNDNKDFNKEVQAQINGLDWLIYQDAGNYCDWDEYDRAFDRICDAIQSQNDLPYDWYINGKIEEM